MAVLPEPLCSMSSGAGCMAPVKILLYRRRLSLNSGAGQLIRRQAEGLKSAGEPVCVVCDRGRIGFFLRTRLPVKRNAPSVLNGRRRGERHFLVDHEAQCAGAGIVFVHNLFSEARRHVPRPEWDDAAAREAQFFERLPGATPIVANSELVRSAMIEHFGLAAERIVVHRPGYDAARFNLQRAAELRGPARRALGLQDGTPLIGLLTSGDFVKRGLDVFLGAAEEIAAARPDARFLLVGARKLPDWAAGHPLIVGGRVHYEPKTYVPERWMAAMDLFLHTARFEEFGMVLPEVQAMGVPLLTSRRVGAAETLPDAYAAWVGDAPDSGDFAAKALALLDSDEDRERLRAVGIEWAATLDDARYVAETLATIRRHRAHAEKPTA